MEDGGWRMEDGVPGAGHQQQQLQQHSWSVRLNHVSTITGWMDDDDDDYNEDGDDNHDEDLYLALVITQSL